MNQNDLITQPTSRSHYLYIDCVRGYAVLMVIACHLTGEYPGLPWPVKRLVVQGWFGVQLFFLASCLTLLMSWRSDARKPGKASLTEFFIRRFFRIAPAYYAAGMFYYWMTPPKSGFDAWHALESAAFINAWTPAWTPTIKGGWAVVPGSWSISVEFAFYLIFPFFATFARSLLRAFQVFAISLAIGLIANLLALDILAGTYDKVAISNFLFFWFPNQASVFALGGILFFIINDQTPKRLQVAGYSDTLALAAVAIFCMVAYVPFGHYLGDHLIVPAGLVVCLPLMMFVVALSEGNSVFVNKAAGAVGRVSFSAYLLHFEVLHIISSFPLLFHAKSAGFGAVAAYCCGFVVCAGVTYVASYLSYRVIEQPMIALGRRLIYHVRQQAKAVGSTV